jgi:glucosamine--fructose-6-phosphate aminotransferase (isomerizing)
MLKEIFEQPQTIYDCLRGRLDASAGTITMSGIQQYAEQIVKANRIVMIACGTSWHAGLVAEYIFEELCRINVEVEYASEFRYRNPVIHKGDVIIAISQSGETADTLVAIENAKQKGAIILGVVNVVGSSIAAPATVAPIHMPAGNRRSQYKSIYRTTCSTYHDCFEDRIYKRYY